VLQSLNQNDLLNNIFLFQHPQKIISCVMSYQHKFHASFQGQQNVAELAFLQLANIPSTIPHNI